MAIKITIKGNQETNEYKDALALKQIIEHHFNSLDINGEMLIISNATLFGQSVKDVDLILLVAFEKYSCRVKSTAVNDKKESLELKDRTIFVNNLCFVIETKGHIAEDLELNGVHLLAKYKGKLKDITTQSENQKYSLGGFLKDRLNFSPYICNFIWFRNVSQNSLNGLVGGNENVRLRNNYLPSTFNFPLLIEKACVQNSPYNPTDKVSGTPKGYSSLNALKKGNEFDFERMKSVFDVFQNVKQGAGDLTRQKIEKITSKLLDQQLYAQAIGQKFVVISGRAGTGKTIKLLRIACDLAINKGARSLILTFNHALVSDIKRTLALAEIPDGVDSYSVGISTLHKFFYELLIGFGIAKNPDNPEAEVKYISDYFTKYNTYLKELYEYIDQGIIQEKEIQDLMKSRHDKVSWDYILIDESQDWSEIEKSIIFRIFGKEHTIIADGIDQLIRSQDKCNWTRGLKIDKDFIKTFEKKGLRQKVNLISFVNEVAKELGIVWELEPKQELVGGKIIVSTKPYSKEIHDNELARCKKYGNTEYEMMFLVPPNMVVSNTDEKKKGTRQFKYVNEFENMGIKIWDGTSTELRSEYVVELNQHRLLQYESCRGLEGWTVVCLNFDDFIKWKIESFKDEKNDELALESFDEKRDKFVYLWSLIPLTRAIDTIVITINDKNSKFCKALRKVYERKPDFIQWIE